MSLLSIFGTAILPIVAIAAVGFVLGRQTDVDPDPLNTVTVYVFAPALVFHSLSTTTLSSGTLVRVTVGVVAYAAVMLVLTEALGRLLGSEEPLLSAVVLVATFSNAGNYGIPLSEFAFGAVGRSTAVLYLAGQAVLMYTVGVYVASRSGGTRGFAGVRRVLTLPLLYAVLAALLVRWLGVVPPAGGNAMQTVKLVGDAAIPVMLVILGIQLARTDYGAALSRVGPPTVLKMAVAPAVAVGIALLLDFGNATVARTFVLESSMPSAVTPLILLMEFSDVDVGGISVPEYVSTVVLVTTLSSIPVLTVLIALLDSGALV
ncbi:MAG: AEC family transporter [Haloferacaceae archaeon]